MFDFERCGKCTGELGAMCELMRSRLLELRDHEKLVGGSVVASRISHGVEVVGQVKDLSDGFLGIAQQGVADKLRKKGCDHKEEYLTQMLRSEAQT